MLKKLLLPTAALYCLFTVLSCTPKTTEPVTNTPPVTTPSPTPPPVELSPCPKFTDAPNTDDAETWYVLYRDFLRAQDYETAYGYWRKTYEVAPAADGQRNTVFSDGIFFYETFYSQTGNVAYIDSIFMMYDEIDKCYPEGGYVAGRKAFDYYYKYKERASKEQIYALFKESIDADGIETNDFVINPFTALLTEMHDSNLVSDAEAEAYAEQITAIIEHGVANCEGVYCERWEIIQEFAPVRLEYFETVKGFYDCDYYVDKYYPQYQEYPDSCDLVTVVLSRMNWGECQEGQAEYDEVLAKYNESCRATAGGLAGEAYELLQEGDYDGAIEKFLQAAEEETDNMERKGALYLLIAKIYYVHKKRFSTARRYAQQAADVRSGWGEPYILIGRMYASSGPLCGPGRGWDSQIVVWAALDMWSYAKRIDPSVSREANSWIGRYAQYMPKREDVFIRNLSVGDSYFIPCWIQRSTSIRTAD